MANLIEHYLLQLKSLLPAKLRDDVAAELAESIRSSVAERERALGRALNDDELAGVLKGYGHPLLVAGRYLPMQELIGPRLFPLYWYTLQAVVIVIAVVTGVLIGIALLTVGRGGLSVLWDGVGFALTAAACVTFLFAALDRGSVRLKLFEDFDPRKLELGIFGVRAAPLSAIPRSDTVFEIATLAIFVAWWLDWISFTPRLGSGVSIAFTSAIEPFFWPLLVLAVVDLARLAVDFVYPYRTWPRVLARLLINIAWLAALVTVFRTDGLLTVIADAGVETTDSSLAIARLVFNVTVAGMTLVTAALVATDVVRLVRR
jgi:hypothetical protein